MARAKKPKAPKASLVLGKHVAIYVGFIAAGVLIAAGLYVQGHHTEIQIPGLNPYAEILFGGDMMFDRSIRTTIEQKGGDYIFSCLDDVFHSNDLVVANLEGPITDNPSISQNSKMGDSNNFTFTFPPSTAALLYKHNVRLV